MSLKSPRIAAVGLGASLLGACASSGGLTDLGEGKQEFEQYAQGGNYRFQYVAVSEDTFRTILWRQGESLSDDRKDEKLVAGVVRSVFHERFCKNLKLPVSFAEGSPAPTGLEGKWSAALTCANPPPPPKPAPEKKKAKPRPAPETASTSEPGAKPAAKPRPSASASSDGPVECVANSQGGFDCKPKR
jgi:hypothetical protein